MNSVVARLLRPFVTVHPGERPVALLMFAYSFLAMTAWNILRPLTRSKFIADLGAENLPYVQLAAGVLIGLLMHVYGGVVGRLPRHAVIPATQGAIVALLVAFWALLRTGAAWVGVAFYFLGLVLGILLISQFWMLANDIYDARQAKRLFGLIGGGACLGGAVGAALTATIVARVGAANMVLVAAAVLAVCIAIVVRILRRHSLSDRAVSSDAEPAIGAREAFRLVRASSHLRLIALVIGLAAAGAQVIDQQLNMAADASSGTEGEEGVAAYLAQITAYVSLAGFFVQVGVTRWIHHSFGMAVALLLLPVGLGLTGALILVTGALWAPAVARVVDATLRYTVDKTTREVLFLPVAPELRYPAKPFIDVTSDRVARGIAALLLLVLIQPWGLGLDWVRLSYASLGITAVWIATALIARRAYLRAFRHSIDTQALSPDAIRTEVGDSASIEALVDELSNPEPAAVLYAIDMLEALDKTHLISPLLLQHDSAPVRARALRGLIAVRSPIAIHWMPAVERLVHDDDVDVRAAALRALAELSREDGPAVLRRHLADPEPRVATAACIGLAASAHQEDVAAAEATLKRLIADTHVSGTIGRQEAAVALGHVRAVRFRLLLVPLLYDREASVVERAIRSARELGADDGLFVPRLISLLGHRLLKAAARAALAGCGVSVVPALAHALHDVREDPWVRRHIPATLAAIPCQPSVDALVTSLRDADGFLRYKAIIALEQLRRDHTELDLPGAAVERLALQETARYFNHLVLAHDVQRGTSGAASLLTRALEEKRARTLDRLFRLLGLLYGSDDVAAARYAIQHGTPRRRAAAVEYLDNLLDGPLRRRVLPILDDAPVAETLRLAYATLKTRARDLPDALAQLVHDADPVVAAAAVHFVAETGLQSFDDDLRFLLAHRSADSEVAAEASAWALSRRHAEATGRYDPLPTVELAHRLRTLPLFQFLSVDELFRLAARGEEVHYAAGRELWRSGEIPRHADFLVAGTVFRDEPGGAVQILSPAVLGLEEILQGVPADAALHAGTSIVCLQIEPADFLSMVADNVLLAQSLFSMLLADVPARALAGAVPSALRTAPQAQHGLDRALMLRQHPLLAVATPGQLLAVVAAGREVALRSGDTIFDTGTPASVYLVLDGELVIADAEGTTTARAGTVIGLTETLAGSGTTARATVGRPGRALWIGRDDLFGALTDHVDLLQRLFSRVLALRKTAVTLRESGIQSPPVRTGAASTYV